MYGLFCPFYFIFLRYSPKMFLHALLPRCLKEREKIKERESVRMTILISLKKINFDVNKFLCTRGVK
jgi:hypothetical protein